MMRRIPGFSLVEVTLAIGIIGFAMLAIFALIPVGLNSGREAIDATHTGLISQDIQNRVRNSVTNTTFSNASSVTLGPWFYDRNGVFVDTSGAAATRFASVIYRADAVIHSTWDPQNLPPNVDSAVLRPVTSQLHWPVNSSDGSIIGANLPGATFTFYVRRP
jgi:uncharacterized protein (TIGR02598 family)